MTPHDQELVAKLAQIAKCADQSATECLINAISVVSGAAVSVTLKWPSRRRGGKPERAR